MLGVRLVTEDDVPSPLLEQTMQSPMDILAVRADVNAPNFPGKKINERRNDQDLRLLNVGFQVIDPVERTENVGQGNAAHELDLGHEVMTRHEVLGESGRIVDQQIA